MGDFNAKVGEGDEPGIVGKFGLGERNEAGDRLMQFCQENNLQIANTFFMQPKRRLYTWSHPDGIHRNQIDFILCQKRWSSVSAAKTLPGADCGSDHQLLVASLKLKLCRIKKTHVQQKFDTEKISHEYTVKVKDRVAHLNSEVNIPEELWQAIKTTILETAQEHIPLRKRQKTKKMTTGRNCFTRR